MKLNQTDGIDVSGMHNANGQLAFETGGSERMRIDSSGNVVAIGTIMLMEFLKIAQQLGGNV